MSTMVTPHPIAVRPPGWLIAATGLLALASLAMAVAETNLWMHFLIDAGESLSLVGLAFILAAGLYLYRRRRLAVSLPLTLPWLLLPVITQGDQIIDNLSINWMRLICHVLLAALFGAPVAIVVVAARYAIGVPGAIGRTRGWYRAVPGLTQLADGRIREGTAVLAALLLVAETWVAVQFLGALMVITLIVMIWGVLIYGSAGRPHMNTDAAPPRPRSERVALAALVIGVVASLGLYLGYKNRPGAYQGSPSYFMDPAQTNGGFRLDRIAVPNRPPSVPADSGAVAAALTGYARAFERLLAGYYVLDRNYNYDFHNRLFLRHTPLLADYRMVGSRRVEEAKTLRAEADRRADAVRSTLAADDPLGALLDDVRAYAAFTFDRAPVLERMSAEFARTQAGLQHATHLYEGEGKVLGVRLAEILDKHRAVLSASALFPVTADFVRISRSVHDTYANRIVGF